MVGTVLAGECSSVITQADSGTKLSETVDRGGRPSSSDTRRKTTAGFSLFCVWKLEGWNAEERV